MYIYVWSEDAFGFHICGPPLLTIDLLLIAPKLQLAKLILLVALVVDADLRHGVASV
jgi:hypothetical protein